MPSSLAHPVGGVRACVQADCCDGVDGDCHVLCCDSGVAQRLGDGWDEVGNCSSTEIEYEEKHEGVGAWVDCGSFEGFPMGETFVIASIGFLAVDNDADSSELSLLET